MDWLKYILRMKPDNDQPVLSKHVVHHDKPDSNVLRMMPSNNKERVLRTVCDVPVMLNPAHLWWGPKHCVQPWSVVLLRGTGPNRCYNNARCSPAGASWWKPSDLSEIYSFFGRGESLHRLHTINTSPWKGRVPLCTLIVTK